MAAKVELPEFVRGDKWVHKLEFSALNFPIDITGWTFWLTLKLDPTKDDDEAALQIVKVANDDDAEIGHVYLIAEESQTEVLIPTEYQFDIQFKTDGGAVQTVCYGEVPVARDITRSR